MQCSDREEKKERKGEAGEREDRVEERSLSSSGIHVMNLNKDFA